MQNGEDVVDNEIRACLISAISFNYSAIKNDIELLVGFNLDLNTFKIYLQFFVLLSKVKLEDIDVDRG